MKVLFLDLDGVINHEKTPHRTDGKTLIMNDPLCVFRVNKIVDRTGCKVVMSSSWRHSHTWREDAKAQGLVFDFLDRTGDSNCRMRGCEIRKWMETKRLEGVEIEKYAIVDDDSDMLLWQKDSFFKTTWKDGLTEEIAQKVEEHLK